MKNVFNILMIVVAVLCMFTAQTYAGTGRSTDVSVVYGTASYGNGTGASLGNEWKLDETLAFRTDISYIPFGAESNYTRVPIAVSLKLYFPYAERFRGYFQLGGEVSFDSWEYTYTLPGFGSTKIQEDKTRFGVTPALGTEFDLNKEISIFFDVREHFIEDKYDSVSLGLKYNY